MFPLESLFSLNGEVQVEIESWAVSGRRKVLPWTLCTELSPRIYPSVAGDLYVKSQFPNRSCPWNITTLTKLITSQLVYLFELTSLAHWHTGSSI